MPMRLYLVRHGEVDANRQLAFVGRGQDPLTPVGVEQADGLAVFFSRLSIDRVISSPLERCRATAVPIARASSCRVVTDARIVEQSFGKWEGLTREQIEESGSAARELMRRWRRDPSGRPPGGESLSEVRRRALDLAQELELQDLDDVVWVSHVGPIKAVVCHALGLDLSHVGRLFLDPASISVVDWKRRPILRVFNAHSEVGWRSVGWLGRR